MFIPCAVKYALCFYAGCQFKIKYLSPYRHISQFRIHEISCIHRSFLAKYFKLYYSYRHIGTGNSVIIPIVDME